MEYTLKQPPPPWPLNCHTNKIYKYKEEENCTIHSLAGMGCCNTSKVLPEWEIWFELLIIFALWSKVHSLWNRKKKVQEMFTVRLKGSFRVCKSPASSIIFFFLYIKRKKSNLGDLTRQQPCGYLIAKLNWLFCFDFWEENGLTHGETTSENSSIKEIKQLTSTQSKKKKTTQTWLRKIYHIWCLLRKSQVSWLQIFGLWFLLCQVTSSCWFVALFNFFSLLPLRTS